MAPRNDRYEPELQVRNPSRSFLNALDNFYAPARDKRGEQAFQQGIASLSGVLEGKAAEAKEERNQAEYQQGIQDAMREAAGEELQGVRTGSLFRQHSKFYMMGLNETRGRAAGRQFKSNLTLAYEQWEGRHTDDDGSAFREWMNGQVSDFMGTLGDNQYMFAGAMPVINEVATNFAGQHTAFTAQRLETESFEAYDEIISGVFSDLAGGELGEGAEGMAAAIAVISEEADMMYDTDGAAANDRVVEAAIRWANIHNDPDSLLVLAQAHDSGALKLSQFNREKLANAMDAVEADIEREASRVNRQATAEEKAAQEVALTEWGTILEADPYAELPRVGEVGAKTWKAMEALQAAFIESAEVTNPAITQGQRMIFENELYTATTQQEKMAILTDFVRSNPTAMTSTQVATYMKEIFASSDPGNLVNDPTIARFRSGFGKTVAEFQLGAGYDTQSSSSLQTRVLYYYDQFLLAKSGSVDMSDPAAIHALTKEAEAWSIQQAAFELPEVIREKLGDSGLGPLLGISGALEVVDQANAEAAEEKATNDAATYEGFANGDEPVDTPEVEPEVQTPSIPDTGDGSPLGMIGGVRSGEGDYWQGLDDDGLAHASNPDYKDYSQLYREYSYIQGDGWVAVGERDGRTIYAAPDYTRDDDGNYLSVSSNEAAKYARQDGGLIPTQEEVQALYAQAHHISMPTQNIGETGGPGDSGVYTQAVDAEMADLPAGTLVVHGKEFSQSGVPSAPTVEDNDLPFNDPDTEEAYEPMREGFYGELIHRFTDGKDTRSRLNEAMSVLQDDPEFATAVNRLADKYHIPPAMLTAVMEFESGVNPSIRNAAGSGATGLIQFMPSTAKALGTTTDELARMSRAEQMVYVEKYFDQFAHRIRGGQIEDIYMAVLWPKAIGKPGNYAIFTEGTIAYRQNAGLDKNGDGTVTKSEAASAVTALYYR